MKRFFLIAMLLVAVGCSQQKASSSDNNHSNLTSKKIEESLSVSGSPAVQLVTAKLAADSNGQQLTPQNLNDQTDLSFEIVSDRYYNNINESRRPPPLTDDSRIALSLTAHPKNKDPDQTSTIEVAVYIYSGEKHQLVQCYFTPSVTEVDGVQRIYFTVAKRWASSTVVYLAEAGKTGEFGFWFVVSDFLK